MEKSNEWKYLFKNYHVKGNILLKYQMRNQNKIAVQSLFNELFLFPLKS